MNHPLGTNMFQLHMFFSTVLKVSSEIPENLEVLTMPDRSSNLYKQIQKHQGLSRHDFQVDGRKDMSWRNCVWYIQVASGMMALALFLFCVSCVSHLLDFDLLMVSSVMWL